METVTLYVIPLRRAVGKVKFPFALTDRVSPPLSCNWRPPAVPTRFITVPPMVKVFVVHVTVTFATLLLTVPLPEVTTQVWFGLVGWVNTVTLYVVPLAIAAVKVNDDALADIVR